MSIYETAVTYITEQSLGTLLPYACEKREEGMFNDIKIKAGNIISEANKMVLSCYSEFFEKLFHSQMKEQHQDTIEIKGFDGKAVEMLIEFIYDGDVIIEQENVMELLAVSDFMQVEEIMGFCYDFLQRGITVNNCIHILASHNLYRPHVSVDKVYCFIGKHLDEIVQTEPFNSLSRKELVSLVKNLYNAKPSSIYEAVRHWIEHDKNQRKEDFNILLRAVKLYRLSDEYLEKVMAYDELVKENPYCINAVVTEILKKKEQTLRESGIKILTLGGYGKTVFEVYNITGISNTNTTYPDLPVVLHKPCVVNIKNVIYCIGGLDDESLTETSRVYCLNLNEQELEWEQICSMNDARAGHFAASFKTGLVCSGASGSSNLAEFYENDSNEWRQIAPLSSSRHEHAVVECNDHVYNIGGYLTYENRSVERLSNINGEWEVVSPMLMTRASFAAVNCDGFIYAIGGLNEDFMPTYTVQKYDPIEDRWSYVSSMNKARHEHSACVLQGRIFVVGGVNYYGNVVEIECYDPNINTWSIVANATHWTRNQAVVAV